MGSAICLPNGKPVSNREYTNIRHTTNIIAQKLVNWIISSNVVVPRFKLTKLAIKGCFKSKYDEVVLKLEAQHNLLCLCSAHWKADSMLGQALLRREDKTVAQIVRIIPSSQDPFNTNKPHPLEPSCIRDVIPANVTKHTFQLSPGPKLPSALRTQKCSKDGAVPSGWTTHTECQPPVHAGWPQRSSATLRSPVQPVQHLYQQINLSSSIHLVHSRDPAIKYPLT